MSTVLSAAKNSEKLVYGGHPERRGNQLERLDKTAMPEVETVPSLKRLFAINHIYGLDGGRNFMPSFQHYRAEQGLSTIVEEYECLMYVGDSHAVTRRMMDELCEIPFDDYRVVRMGNYLVYYTQDIVDVIVFTESGAYGIDFTLFGDREVTRRLRDVIKQQFPCQSRMVTTLDIGPDGSLVRSHGMVPLESAEMIYREHYPFLDRTPEEQMLAFLSSSSNVMLLIGPPGTGKSTYLRAMLDSLGERRVITIDSQDVLMHRGLGNVIRMSDQNTVFIAEDADAFVGKRENGNPQMSMLLNLADGIVRSDRKFIISTNLPSLNKVDSALIRPGRCFDILEFRKLSGPEASIVRRLHNPEAPDFAEDKLSLAEVLNYEAASEIHRRNATGAGLISTR